MVHLLHPVAPYDLAKVWEFLANSEGVAPSAQKRTLIRSWMLDGAPVVVRLEDIGTMNAPVLEAELVAGDEADWPRIEAALRRSLSLDVDLAPLVEAAKADPPLAALLEQMRGYHMVALPTPFEAAVWAVLKQNTFQALARSNWRKLQEAFGQTVRIDGRDVPCFPDPKAFLRLTSKVRLRALKIRRKHVEYLQNVAEVFTHELSDAELETMEPDEVRAVLAAVPGMGPWSVQYVGIRGFAFHDSAGVMAPSVQRKAGQLYGRPLTARETRAIAESYEPYGAFWEHLIRNFVPDAPRPVRPKAVRSPRTSRSRTR